MHTGQIFCKAISYLMLYPMIKWWNKKDDGIQVALSIFALKMGKFEKWLSSHRSAMITDVIKISLYHS